MRIKLDETLRHLRAERGMSQKELADRLSVTPQSVSRWETGQAYPDMETLPRLADIFQVSVDRLLGRESSFIAQKEEELRAAQQEVVDERDFKHRQKVCDILEELAAHGSAQYAFFREARALERGGVAKPMQVERARQYCREMLERMDADERIAWLLDILPCEDEEKWDLWRAYAPRQKMITDWEDVLLEQYPPLSEKGKKQRQVVLYRTVEKLLYRLSYQHSQLALDTLNVYSKETGDIFLPQRISAEMWVAVALFGEDRVEEGFEMLSKVLEHLRLIVRLGGARVRGSIPELSLIEQPASVSGATFSVAGVRTVMTTREEFDSVKTDARFVAFCRGVNALRRSHYLGISREDSERLEKMEALLQGQADALAEGEWLVALMTSRGEVYRTVLHLEKDDFCQDPPIASLMAEAGDTRIRYLIGLDHFHNMNIPPEEIVVGLIDLDEDNRNTSILIKHGTDYHTLKMGRILEIEDEKCEKAHKFSSNHADKLKEDKICGCFYCLSVFSPDRITQWLKQQKQVRPKVWRMDEQATAVCPHCGVDAVIGESSGFPITKRFLKQMHRYWFERSTNPIHKELQ